MTLQRDEAWQDTLHLRMRTREDLFHVSLEYGPSPIFSDCDPLCEGSAISVYLRLYLLNCLLTASRNSAARVEVSSVSSNANSRPQG